MAGMFEERERGYEAKWAHVQELHFKVMARRNELLGRWAAGEMGLQGGKVDDYARAMVQAGLMGKGADPVFETVRNDFIKGKVDQSDAAIHRKMEELFHAANDEIVG